MKRTKTKIVPTSKQITPFLSRKKKKNKPNQSTCRHKKSETPQGGWVGKPSTSRRVSLTLIMYLLSTPTTHSTLLATRIPHAPQTTYKFDWQRACNHAYKFLKFPTCPLPQGMAQNIPTASTSSFLYVRVYRCHSSTLTVDV